MSHINNGVILKKDIISSYTPGSITVPDWATMIIIDFYGNGGYNENNNYTRMRFNNDSGSSYNDSLRYRSTAYGWSTTTTSGGFLLHFLSTTENDGFTRVIIYPKKDAAQYTQGMSYIMNPTRTEIQNHYLRWLNTVDDVTSIQLYWNTVNLQSISYVARAFK